MGEPHPDRRPWLPQLWTHMCSHPEIEVYRYDRAGGGFDLLVVWETYDGFWNSTMPDVRKFSCLSPEAQAFVNAVLAMEKAHD